MPPAIPPECLIILCLNLAVAIGWVVALARPVSMTKRLAVLAVLAAGAGVWLLGLAMALNHLRLLGLFIGSSGADPDPAAFAGLFGSGLVVAGWSCQLFLVQLVLAMLAFALSRPATATQTETV